ncbi:replication initiator protein A [Enterococcus faecium]|uniref:replication initiator protein A n=1 Tax=Enterococcus faecium TaxID=1352 RepID=UPI000CF1D206|nr:replication initiator protein A [Enterococcus faecium]PQD42338.1 replication initiator protein A [Enterococcus faecium]
MNEKEVESLVEKQGYSNSDIYAELYYQYPIFLNVNEKYKKMKLSSKLVYMLLKDRNRLSLKNNLYDENQKIFLIFEIKNLVEISGMSKNTILSALDELQKVKLLVKRKNGFNKSKMQMFPNFYYLLKPVLCKDDVYKINKITHQENSQKNLIVQNLNYGTNQYSVDSSKNELESYKSYKDSKDIKESHNDVFSDSLLVENTSLDKKLIESFIEENLLEQILGEKIVNCLKLASNSNYRQFNAWYKKFNYAIKSAEKEQKAQLKIMNEICNDTNFVEYIREQLAMTLRDLIRRAKTDHRIKQKNDYFFISLKNKALELIKLQKKEGI